MCKYDISPATVDWLDDGEDPTGDVGDIAVWESVIEFDTDPTVIEGAKIVVVTVPTPVIDENHPNFDLWRMPPRRTGITFPRVRLLCSNPRCFPVRHGKCWHSTSRKYPASELARNSPLAIRLSYSFLATNDTVSRTS